MRLALLLILLSVCNGCAHGPKVTVCIVDAFGNTLECSAPDGSQYSQPVSESDNYLCLSPDDAQTVFNYLKSRCNP
jgi:hypothetical protein